MSENSVQCIRLRDCDKRINVEKSFNDENISVTNVSLKSSISRAVPKSPRSPPKRLKSERITLSPSLKRDAPAVSSKPSDAGVEPNKQLKLGMILQIMQDLSPKKWPNLNLLVSVDDFYEIAKTMLSDIGDHLRTDAQMVSLQKAYIEKLQKRWEAFFGDYLMSESEQKSHTNLSVMFQTLEKQWTLRQKSHQAEVDALNQQIQDLKALLNESRENQKVAPNKRKQPLKPLNRWNTDSLLQTKGVWRSDVESVKKEIEELMLNNEGNNDSNDTQPSTPTAVIDAETTQSLEQENKRLRAKINRIKAKMRRCGDYYNQLYASYNDEVSQRKHWFAKYLSIKRKSQSQQVHIAELQDRLTAQNRNNCTFSLFGRNS